MWEVNFILGGDEKFWVQHKLAHLWGVDMVHSVPHTQQHGTGRKQSRCWTFVGLREASSWMVETCELVCPREECWVCEVLTWCNGQYTSSSITQATNMVGAGLCWLGECQVEVVTCEVVCASKHWLACGVLAWCTAHYTGSSITTRRKHVCWWGLSSL